MINMAQMKWNGACIAALIFLTLFAGCGDRVGPGTAEVKRQAITGVTVTAVQLSKISDDYETSGTVRAKVSSNIASRVTGTVTAVHVRAGERVKAGQLLATIDDRDAAQKVRAAEQAYEAARQSRSMADLTYQRYKKLHDEKALARQEIDQIETQKKVADAQYEQAKAGLEEARVWQGFTRVPAPAAVGDRARAALLPAGRFPSVRLGHARADRPRRHSRHPMWVQVLFARGREGRVFAGADRRVHLRRRDPRPGRSCRIQGRAGAGPMAR